MDFHKTEPGQPGGDILATGFARLVFVEHDDDLAVRVRVPANQILLHGGQPQQLQGELL